jgi:hypothetical protein
VTSPHEPLSKRNTRLVVCNKQRLFQKDFEWFETLLSIMKWKERKERLTLWTVREARRHVKKKEGDEEQNRTISELAKTITLFSTSANISIHQRNHKEVLTRSILLQSSSSAVSYTS